MGSPAGPSPARSMAGTCRPSSCSWGTGRWACSAGRGTTPPRSCGASASRSNSTCSARSCWPGSGLIAVGRAGRGWLGATLAYPRLVWLGKISYGLYMYHEIALWLGRRADRLLGWFPNNEVLLPIGAFAATVGLAALSYYRYER